MSGLIRGSTPALARLAAAARGAAPGVARGAAPAVARGSRRGWTTLATDPPREPLDAATPNAAFPDALLAAMPKVDLHVHLDGSVRLGTMIDIAKEQGIAVCACAGVCVCDTFACCLAAVASNRCASCLRTPWTACAMWYTTRTTRASRRTWTASSTRAWVRGRAAVASCGARRACNAPRPGRRGSAPDRGEP